jgi:hypothetical protein
MGAEQAHGFSEAPGVPGFADQMPKFVKHKRSDLLTTRAQDQPRVSDADDPLPPILGGVSVGEYVTGQWIPITNAMADHDRAQTIVLLKADKRHDAINISTLSHAYYSEAERPILVAELRALVKEGHWRGERWQPRSKQKLRPIKFTRCMICNKPILSVEGMRRLCRTEPWMLIGTSCRAIWRNGGVPRVINLPRMLRKTPGGAMLADPDQWVPPVIRETY